MFKFWSRRARMFFIIQIYHVRDDNSYMMIIIVIIKNKNGPMCE